jgi:glycosyltransferase involved in cell wall biosynthesis
MAHPVISVITTCYNSGVFLSEAIESILSQTFKDFEHILIDDGSTDNTLDIIKTYARRDQRIVFSAQKFNTGSAATRNIGIQMAKGEWIAILDSDDIALPMRLERQISYVKMNPHLVLLGSGYIEIDASGEFIKEHYYPPNHQKLVARLDRGLAFPPHSSCLYRTEAVKLIRGFNQRFFRAQDYDLWLRLRGTGPIACLHDILVKVRRRDSSLSHADHGEKLTIDATAALTCYLLRKKGFPDPSNMDMRTWNIFFNWLKTKLEREGLIESRKLWDCLRQEWYSKKNTAVFTRALKFAIALVNSNQGFNLLHQKLFGLSLTGKLANEWVQFQAIQS